MGLSACYGHTPLSYDEFAALTTPFRAALSQADKQSIYLIEQDFERLTTEKLVASVVDGDLGVPDLLTDFFLRSLHQELYGEIWVWAGKYRVRELNIGIAPELIAAQVRQALGSALWRWENNGLEAHPLGIAVHAELVHIHPFVDGNGRTTRLLANLVYLAAQTGTNLQVYDWDLDKTTYIRLLREYDQHHNPKDLAEFIQTHPLNQPIPPNP